MNRDVRFKLSIMMFLQYAIWGAWAVSMGGYMDKTLLFTGVQIGSIYSTTAIAAMISPLFMGYIADRFLATERMIGLLHLIGAVLLAVAGFTEDFFPLYVIMLAYSICYMPTLALTNSISFANISDPEKDFPGIRVFGTWGWIIAGWVVAFVLDSLTKTPILLAAGLSAGLGVFSFTLPHTPPRAAGDDSVEDADASRSSILQLLNDSSFLVFVICSFLVCIPLSFYYGFANVFLQQVDAPYPVALQTIGQLSEVGFMAAMPFFILRLGVKKMLAVGMFAWALRYFCFGTLSLPLIVFGLFLHGICYDFFFVASQIYVDSRVAKRQRASAQSFIAFVTMGVGMFVGAYVGGWTVDEYPPRVQVEVTRVAADGTTSTGTAPLPNWDNPQKTGLADKLGLKQDSTIRPADITEEFVVADERRGTKTIYQEQSLIAGAIAADTNNDKQVSHTEWRMAQRNQWVYIWLWPAVAALATLAIFWVGFRDRRNRAEEREMAEEAPLGPGEGPEPQVG